jgi:hypothetical protein
MEFEGTGVVGEADVAVAGGIDEGLGPCGRSEGQDRGCDQGETEVDSGGVHFSGKLRTDLCCCS